VGSGTTHKAKTGLRLGLVLRDHEGRGRRIEEGESRGGGQKEREEGKEHIIFKLFLLN
jgi:hypothetical protein